MVIDPKVDAEVEVGVMCSLLEIEAHRGTKLTTEQISLFRFGYFAGAQRGVEIALRIFREPNK